MPQAPTVTAKELKERDYSKSVTQPFHVYKYNRLYSELDKAVYARAVSRFHTGYTTEPEAIIVDRLETAIEGTLFRKDNEAKLDRCHRISADSLAKLINDQHYEAVGAEGQALLRAASVDTYSSLRPGSPISPNVQKLEDLYHKATERADRRLTRRMSELRAAIDNDGNSHLASALVAEEIVAHPRNLFVGYSKTNSEISGREDVHHRYYGASPPIDVNVTYSFKGASPLDEPSTSSAASQAVSQSFLTSTTPARPPASGTRKRSRDEEGSSVTIDDELAEIVPSATTGKMKQAPASTRNLTGDRFKGLRTRTGNLSARRALSPVARSLMDDPDRLRPRLAVFPGSRRLLQSGDLLEE